MKSVLGEFHSGVSSLYALTNVLSQIWGPVFTRPSRPGGTGVLPPALTMNVVCYEVVCHERDLF